MTSAMQLKLFAEEVVKLANMKHRAVGRAGETMARLMLERSGYDVVTSNRHGGDFVAISRATGEMWRVEVKTSRRTKNGQYQFLLRKNDRYGTTDHRSADIVLLLAIRKSGVAVPFVVPVAALADIKAFKMRADPQKYAGRLACYRQGRTLRLENM